MGENQAKSDILLVVVPIVVPNGSDFFWEWSVQGLWQIHKSNHCTLASGVRFKPLLARQNDSKKLSSMSTELPVAKFPSNMATGFVTEKCLPNTLAIYLEMTVYIAILAS
jgi:hypothetical protein